MGFLSNLFSDNSNVYRDVFLKAYPNEPWYCVSCGKALYKREGIRKADDKLTVDHIIPKQVFKINGKKYGGLNHISNLQPMCQSCNTKKKDKINVLTAQYSGEALVREIKRMFS